MGERPSEYARDGLDFYVEPAWCVEVLLDRIQFPDGFHDPCAGLATIPQEALSRQVHATAADIVARPQSRWSLRQQDFLTDPGSYPSIVTNPPYSKAVQVIEHALDVVRPGGYVCALVQAKFLFSQRRRALFDRGEMWRVIILSRRPSMPPGEMLIEKGESCRGGGSIDFLWAIWRVLGGPSLPIKPRIEWAA